MFRITATLMQPSEKIFSIISFCTNVKRAIKKCMTLIKTKVTERKVRKLKHNSFNSTLRSSLLASQVSEAVLEKNSFCSIRLPKSSKFSLEIFFVGVEPEITWKWGVKKWELFTFRYFFRIFSTICILMQRSQKVTSKSKLHFNCSTSNWNFIQWSWACSYQKNWVRKAKFFEKKPLHGSWYG